MENILKKCPQCNRYYVSKYPLFSATATHPIEYLYECAYCGFSWKENNSQKLLDYHAPKEIEERRNQILPKLTQDYWTELQIDIYEFEHGHNI